MSHKQAKKRSKLLKAKALVNIALSPEVSIKTQSKQFALGGKVKPMGFQDLTKRSINKPIKQELPRDLTKLIIDIKTVDGLRITKLKGMRSMPNLRRVDSDYVKPKFQSIKTGKDIDSRVFSVAGKLPKSGKTMFFNKA